MNNRNPLLVASLLLSVAYPAGAADVCGLKSVLPVEAPVTIMATTAARAAKTKTHPAPSEQDVKAAQAGAPDDGDQALAADLLSKALQSPGMFGVYRYMTRNALAAMTVIVD